MDAHLNAVDQHVQALGPSVKGSIHLGELHDLVEDTLWIDGGCDHLDVADRVLSTPQ